MVDFELELETEYPWRVGCENSLSLTMNLTFSPDLSPHSYRQITRMEDRDVVYNIQFSSGAEETRVPFNTENFRRALGAFPFLSGHAIQCEDYVDVQVLAKDCQDHWIASVVEELCAWRKLILRARVNSYRLWISASTLKNLSPSQLYQTSITNVVLRAAPEIFSGCVQHQFDGNYPWKEDFHLLNNSPTPAFTDPTPYFRFQIICEPRSKDAEKQIDFVYFRRLLLSVFAFVLKSSYGLHARIEFNFKITFHICSDCSPLITSVVAHILNILADYHPFLQNNYSLRNKCWWFCLSVDRIESSSHFLKNLVERHFLNFFVRYSAISEELILEIPFPQTMEFINPLLKNVRCSTGGTPRS
eukprot:scpid90233/ scgid15121/ 